MTRQPRIKDKYRDEDGKLDVSQLYDDLDQYTSTEDDIMLLKGLKAEIEDRVEGELQ